MNDFEYDVMQKKRIARGAHHMKRGSKSRRCTLPSDYMTAAQLKARNGPLKTYNLNAPMCYEEFKQMPRDLQTAYINGLQKRFGVGVAKISAELFEGSKSMLLKYTRDKGIALSGEGKKLNKEERKRWQCWLRGEKLEEISTEAAHLSEAPAETPTKATFEVATIAAEFVGTFDSKELLKRLASLPVPSGSVRIKVEVTRA